MRGVQVAPRDVVAAALPDPATLGERMSGRTCAGTWVTGTGKDGAPRSTYLYHVVDNETTMREYSSQAVVWQTAVNPAVALELLDGVTGREPGCSARRRSRRRRSWSCSRSTAHRTARSSCPLPRARIAAARPPRRAGDASPAAAWRSGLEIGRLSGVAEVDGRRHDDGADSGLEDPRRALFGLSRKELLEDGPGGDHDDQAPRIIPPMPNHSGSVIPAIGLEATFS